MKHFFAMCMVFFASLLFMAQNTTASTLDNYPEDDYYGLEEDGNKDVIDDGLVLTLPGIQKRVSSTYKYRKYCVPRGGNCDHRPNSCCNSGSCRCNLWGGNCKCQRMGFFQRLGK